MYRLFACKDRLAGCKYVASLLDMTESLVRHQELWMEHYLAHMSLSEYDEASFREFLKLVRDDEAMVRRHFLDRTAGISTAPGVKAIEPALFREKLIELLEGVRHMNDVQRFLGLWFEDMHRRYQEEVDQLMAKLARPDVLLAGPVQDSELRAAAEAEGPAKAVEAAPDEAVVQPLEEKQAAPCIPAPESPVLVTAGPAAPDMTSNPSVATAPAEPANGDFRDDRRRFQGYYRFVDCSQTTLPETETFKVSRPVAAIRSAVDNQSLDLTSAHVVRLVQALEPYGARCESDRKRGIMIKLPSENPEMPYVAKLIHRTHAAHDHFDFHSIKAVKELFDASIFSLERF